EGKRPHIGNVLLLDQDLPARFDDTLAILREVWDVDVEGHVAGPRLGMRRRHDATVDSDPGPGFDQVVLLFRHRLDLPVEDLFVEAGDLLGRSGPHFPVHNGATHEKLLPRRYRVKLGWVWEKAARDVPRLRIGQQIS